MCLPPLFEQTLKKWGVALSSQQKNVFETYLREIEKYNEKVRLTAECSPQQLWRRHILDALVPIPYLRERARTLSPEVADVGAGAGFLGISVKIAWPQTRVTLIESNYKKFQFLNWVIARLELCQIKVYWKRMPEDGKMLHSLFDVVLERALAPFLSAMRVCLPLCRKVGGLWLAYQSDPDILRHPSVSTSLKHYGGASVEVIPYRLPGEKDRRYLFLMERHAVS
ncbi:MAG: 16S rRNA (guanine(527)-N(7))-methyltransferase RsmG [Elusimicrobia bacterium]|nr:16S rRNA (guanine(527)-N(7))-methyltransferase RsmG [Elusimicrobiota bacterium]